MVIQQIQFPQHNNHQIWGTTENFLTMKKQENITHYKERKDNKQKPISKQMLELLIILKKQFHYATWWKYVSLSR